MAGEKTLGFVGEKTRKLFSRGEADAFTGREVLAGDSFAQGDRLEMSVYEGVRSAKRIARVDEVVGESGEIVFGRIGSVEVAGRTPREVERLVESAALRSERGLGVHFTIQLEAWNGSPVVEVRGRVARPGLIVLGSEDMSPVSAIEMAGGMAGPLSAGRVILVREGKERPILVGSRDFDSLELRAGDRVVVD